MKAMKQSPQPFGKRISVSLEVGDARIREVEEKYDLLQYTVDGWCVWPLLRYLVQLEIMCVPRGSKPVGLPMRLRLMLALRDLPGLIMLRKANYLVKSYNQYLRSEPENGLYRDIFFDDLLSETGDHFKIECVANRGFLSRRKHALIKSDVTVTFIDGMVSLLARLGGGSYISVIAEI